MCGIMGGFFQDAPNNLEKNITTALGLLNHRGPDDNGYAIYNNVSGTSYLGHTRLSIIDLSSGGHQPVTSADGRFTMVFNGEIYNYLELRIELTKLGALFKTRSDTEVLLAAWSQWQMETLQKLEGMYAFSVMDHHQQTLTCIRDPFGIKPLFYSVLDEGFVFSSEIAALNCLIGNKNSPNWDIAYQYLNYAQHDYGEETFFKNIKQLETASFVVYSIKKRKIINKQKWWRPSISEDQTLSFDDAVEAVRAQFLDNIKLHLRSDVTVGAALSGGIDSSAVVCAMRHIEPDMPIHTFSFIANDNSISEEKWVDRVNNHIGASEHKIVVSSHDLQRDLDEMIVSQGEPFLSTSIYAQYCVFRAARDQGVKVTLDGQGADELLAGYRGYPGYRLHSLMNNYDLLNMYRFAKNWSKWPNRKFIQPWVHLLSLLIPNKLYDGLYPYAKRGQTAGCLDKNILKEHNIIHGMARREAEIPEKGRHLIQALRASIEGFGLPSLLRYADRNSMRFSIESRVPFLTKTFAEMLFQMPESYLISQQGETKHIFREAMKGIVPQAILNRRDKIGFESPEKAWLLGMSDEVEACFKSATHIPNINTRGLIKQFQGIQEGKLPYSNVIWRALNFIKWYQNQNY